MQETLHFVKLKATDSKYGKRFSKFQPKISQINHFQCKIIFSVRLWGLDFSFVACYSLLITRCKFTCCLLLVANLLTARYSPQIYSLLLTRFINRSLRDHSLQKFRCRSYCCKISLVAHYETGSL